MTWWMWALCAAFLAYVWWDESRPGLCYMCRKRLAPGEATPPSKVCAACAEKAAVRSRELSSPPGPIGQAVVLALVALTIFLAIATVVTGGRWPSRSPHYGELDVSANMPSRTQLDGGTDDTSGGPAPDAVTPR